MNLQQLQEMFEAIQQAQRGHGSRAVTPYSILITLILEDSSTDFCLRAIEAASKIAAQKNKELTRKLTIAKDLTTERRFELEEIEDVMLLNIFNEELDFECKTIAKQAVRDFLAQRGQDLSNLFNEGEHEPNHHQ